MVVVDGKWLKKCGSAWGRRTGSALWEGGFHEAPWWARGSGASGVVTTAAAPVVDSDQAMTRRGRASARRKQAKKSKLDVVFTMVFGGRGGAGNGE